MDLFDRKSDLGFDYTITGHAFKQWTMEAPRNRPRNISQTVTKDGKFTQLRPIPNFRS